MKKILLLCLSLFIKKTINAQFFDGVKIDGSLTSVVENYKKKGYTVVKNIENGVSMKGKALGDNIELLIFGTPKTKLAYKAVVFLTEEKSWHSIKTSYNDLLENLKSKYGEPNSSYGFFKDPYYEGDGYEVSAVKLEKCFYVSFWEDKDNANIMLSISEYMQVRIGYENAKNILIKEEEQKSQNQKVL
jgi:hypothetical protein